MFFFHDLHITLPRKGEKYPPFPGSKLTTMIPNFQIQGWDMWSFRPEGNFTRVLIYRVLIYHSSVEIKKNITYEKNTRSK